MTASRISSELLLYILYVDVCCPNIEIDPFIAAHPTISRHVSTAQVKAMKTGDEDISRCCPVYTIFRSMMSGYRYRSIYSHSPDHFETRFDGTREGDEDGRCDGLVPVHVHGHPAPAEKGNTVIWLRCPVRLRDSTLTYIDTLAL